MNSFIATLINEEKIKLVSVSKEICESYLIKSAKSLQSAKIVLNIDNVEDATALIYFSMITQPSHYFICAV